MAEFKPAAEPDGIENNTGQDPVTLARNRSRMFIAAGPIVAYATVEIHNV